MVSALVLAWVCLILMAFALSGLLWQVRDLKADLANVGAQGRRPLLGKRVPGFDGGRGAVLVIDPGCGMCVPVLSAFAELATELPGLRFHALSYRTSGDWPAMRDVALRIDPDLYQELDVPWSPALLTIDDQGVVTSASPVDTTANLRTRLSVIDSAPVDA
jgi:hypothetical protein